MWLKNIRVNFKQKIGLDSNKRSSLFCQNINTKESLYVITEENMTIKWAAKIPNMKCQTKEI
jgi:hypothetical protein